MRANAGGSAEQACAMRHAAFQMQPAAEPKVQHAAKRSQGCRQLRMQQRMRRDATRRTARGTAMSAPRRTASAAAACAASAAPAADKTQRTATRYGDNSDSWRALPPRPTVVAAAAIVRLETTGHHARVCLPALTARQARGLYGRADPREAHAQLDARRSHAIGLSAATAQCQPKADREPKWERAN